MIIEREHREGRTSVRRNGTRIWAVGCLTLLWTVTGGCDLMDVQNPNNLVQEDLEKPPAATAAVNGAVSTVTRAVGQMNLVYATATDELTWIGSRDAWQQLNVGNISDPANEFSDGAFPFLGEARWMADEAVRLLRTHVDEDPGNAAMRRDLARALFWAGLVYTVIGDMQDDFAFSDRTTPGPPVGRDNMGTVYQTAITNLTDAHTMAVAEGQDELALRARALRARARHALAVWNTLTPKGSVPANPLVNDAQANSDAEAVLAAVGGADWQFRLTYSSSTVGNAMGDWVNQRGEQQFGESYVATDPEDATSIVAFVYMDRIDTDLVDPRVQGSIEEFIAAGSFPPLTMASAREMQLILAEGALAQDISDAGGQFAAHINALRARNGLPAYTGQVDPVSLLEHERAANLFIQGRRLADHYRFGVPSNNWAPGSTAASSPGTFLPITITEIRANPNL